MYHSYFHLNQDPFQISTDPKFLWLGEKHKEALATLNYGILNNKSFLLLTGDVGTGKTTLINALLRGLDKDALLAIIQDPGLERLDFFNYVASAFGIEEKFASKGAFLLAFRKFLKENFYKGKKVILLIDEAQRISQEMLEEVRLLSNLEIEGNKLLNIFFVGQNEFNSLLLRPENKAMRQRITTSYNIPPLSVEEVGKYIEYRLAVAGAREKIFEKGAVREVYRHSKGYPRLINILCDRALLTGFVQGSKRISAALVRESAEELDISGCTTSGYDAAEKEFFEKKGGGTARQGAGIWYLLALFVFLLFGSGVSLWYWFLAPQQGNGWTIFGSRLSSAPLVVEKESETVPGEGVAAPSVAPPASLREAVEPQKAASLVEVKVREAAQAPEPEGGEEASVPSPRPFPRKITLHFAPNAITPESEEGFASLMRFADGVLQREGSRVVIRGYTDTTGPEEYNRRLAEFRANAVKSFLIGRGVNPQNITSVGQADLSREEAGGTPPPSRRVEIEVVGPHD